MPRPTGDYEKMTPEEQKEYREYTASLKLYAHGKAYAWIDVDDKEETETLDKVLLASMELAATFNYETYYRLMWEAGYTREKAEEYASRLRTLDETYADDRWG